MDDAIEEQTFRYDVAFSFLGQDEQLATQINDMIQDRMATFLYSERQREIAGKDGEAAFHQVFGTDARIVVILYRDGWGDKTWTRIERTAIQNRAMEEGYDFTILIPLDDPPTAPKWFPKNRIWIGLDRWGLNGVASVIEARVQEAGGSPRPESAEQRAARLKRELAFSKERIRFRHSEAGVQAAREEFRGLSDEISRICQGINDPSVDMPLTVRTDECDCHVCAPQCVLYLHWGEQWAGSLEHSGLRMMLCEDAERSRGMMVPFFQLNRLREMELDFDIEPSGAKGWRERSGDQAFYLTSDLAQRCVKLLLECIHDLKLGHLADRRETESDARYYDNEGEPLGTDEY